MSDAGTSGIEQMSLPCWENKVSISPTVGCRTADHQSVQTLILVALLVLTPYARLLSHPRSEPRDQARAQRRSAGRTSVAPAKPLASEQRNAEFCKTCERDANGRIRRRTDARRAFQSSHPCPATGSTAGACPGYVVDHSIPLKRGRPDDPSNMQWQPLAEAKDKDRWE